jgi:hypothetical protein
MKFVDTVQKSVAIFEGVGVGVWVGVGEGGGGLYKLFYGQLAAVKKSW